MKQGYRVLRAGVMACGLMITGLSGMSRIGRAQTTPPRFDMLDRNIVRIRTHRDAANGDAASDETGTGVVISAVPGMVRVLTAAHVVKDGSRVNVFFVTDKVTPVPAKVLPNSSDVLDLAVVEVALPKGARVPDRFLVLQYAPNAALQQAEHVWTVNGDWDPVPNTVVHLDHEANPQEFEYTQVSMGEGYSGGPVFDDGGHLLGIHTSGARKSGYNLSVAVKIEAAIDQLDALQYSRATLNGLAPMVARGATPAPNVAGAAPALSAPVAAAASKQLWRDLNNNQMYLVQRDAQRMYIRQANGTVVADLALQTDKKGVKKYAGNSSLSSCPGGGYMEVPSVSETRLDGRIEVKPAAANTRCGGVFGVMRQMQPIAFLLER